MAIEFILQPRSSLDVDESGKTSRLVWVAAPAVTPQEVLDDTGFPVAYNDADPDDANRLCKRIRINASSHRVYSIEAEYAYPPPGQSSHREPDEPEGGYPLVYNWQTITENVPVDKDNAGNPILMSTGRPPSTPPTKPMNYKQLTVTKWQDDYSLATAIAFENHINSDSWEGASAGELLCMVIEPSSSYEAADALIPVDYVFAFKSASVWGPQPHQLTIKDQDSVALLEPVGSADNGTMVRILTRNGEPMDDVPLDGQGAPAIEGLTYRESENGPLAETPAWKTGGSAPTGATTVSSGNITLLRYSILPTVAFSTIGL